MKRRRKLPGHTRCITCVRPLQQQGGLCILVTQLLTAQCLVPSTAAVHNQPMPATMAGSSSSRSSLLRVWLLPPGNMWC